MSNKISLIRLKLAMSSEAPPMIFDVRKKPAFDSDSRMIKTAQWRVHDDVRAWAADIPENSKVTVYCVHGHEVSQNAAKELCDLGFDATYLDGGIANWIEGGYSVS